MRHPIESAKPRQKTLAALLAAGASAKDAAAAVGVSVTYVNVLLKGELFRNEVDEARQGLIGEWLGEYSKRVASELQANLDSLISIRDDSNSKPTDRMRAIELINQAVVPRAKVANKPIQSVNARITLDPQAREAFVKARKEIDLTPNERTNPSRE